MDKENKEKIKKKKVIKNEKEEGEIIDFKKKIIEQNKENVSEQQNAAEMREESKRSQRNTEICFPENKKGQLEMPTGKRNTLDCEKGRNTPEGFYIAHPRNIKRTAHFKDVHSRKLSELLEAFHMFDFDRDGMINHEDLKKTFASLCTDVKDEEIDQMLSEGLNPLNFDAFVIILGYKTLDFDPEEVLLDALSNWDDHQQGLISYDRLLQNIMAWGDRFTEEEAVAALADAPLVLNKTKEKMIDYIQFSEDLCGLRKMMQRKTSNEGN